MFIVNTPLFTKLSEKKKCNNIIIGSNDTQKRG